MIVCEHCKQPIEGMDIDWRHSVCPHDAERFDADPGEYHERCCPCITAGEHEDEL